MRINSYLLQLLRRDSEVLADVEDSFAIWLRGKGGTFDITCFYEELELPGIGLVGSSNNILLRLGLCTTNSADFIKVVAKDSAKLTGYPQLPIHSNHMEYVAKVFHRK